MKNKNLKLGMVSGVVLALMSGAVPVYAAQAKVAAKDTPKQVEAKQAAEKQTGAPPSAVDNLLQRMKPVEEKEASTEQKIGLREALVQAYLKNPDMLAQRAALRSVDEEYAKAVSGYRPTIEGGASYVSTHTNSSVAETGADPKTISVEVTQPLYRGGSTAANVDTADSTIKAQRALLQVKEQDIFLDTATAYLNVIRDQELVVLNANNEKVLREQLEASRQRFKLGDITKTDVSQAEARLASAIAARVAAEGNLKASRAFFEKMTGMSADNLATASDKVVVPLTLEDALAAAEKGNPNIQYALYSRSAAEASTRSISGELLPQISLSGSVERTYDPASSRANDEDSGTLALRATIPFYSGGSTYARIRQSRQIETQRRMDVSEIQRAARQSVIEAWEKLSASNAELQARSAQIDAAKTALDGVKLENQYGSRTTLDLLDAEQEYLDARVARVTTERNQQVASYTLLSSIGQLTAQGLALDARVYDPDKNFQNVKGQWFGGKIQAED